MRICINIKFPNGIKKKKKKNAKKKKKKSFQMDIFALLDQ